jgi:acetyl esterase/lipase/lysophospholipase L1-like esterase
MLHSIRLTVSVLLISVARFASAQTVIPLYDGKAPGSETWTWTEAENNANAFNTRVVYNVVQPTLTAYLPPADLATGTAVVIAPGGGFHTLSIDSEGIEVAKWLNAKGVAAFVLKYRLVHSLTTDPVAELMAQMSNIQKFDADNTALIPLAIADGKRAMYYVRSHAKDYDLLPDHIGLMGFSAGGTVAMGVGFDYTPITRPDFLAPVYAYLGPTAIARQVVPTDAPPLFICAATDDQLKLAPHSAKLYTDWLAANKPAELHMYAKGGHGFGMRKQGLPSDAWIERFGEWLKLNGYLKKLRPAANEQPYTDEQIAASRRADDERARKDWANLAKYAADNQKLLAQPADPNRVVFLGNSIVENWVRRQPTFWAAHPGFAGRGISGQTSGQTLLRFRADVLNLKPAVVVVNVGTNDIAENSGPYDPAFTMGNIQSMVELARAAGVRVVLSSVLPAAGFPWRKTITNVPAKIADLNARIRALAQANKLVYLDYHAAMADAQGAAKPGLTDDGVHPVLTGYEVMATLAEQAVNMARQ